MIKVYLNILHESISSKTQGFIELHYRLYDHCIHSFYIRYTTTSSTTFVGLIQNKNITFPHLNQSFLLPILNNKPWGLICCCIKYLYHIYFHFNGQQSEPYQKETKMFCYNINDSNISNRIIQKMRNDFHYCKFV